jgi:heme oxygenase
VTLVSSVAIRGRQAPQFMTDHSIAAPPGSAPFSAAPGNPGLVLGHRSMLTAAPVKTESPSVLHRALRAATRSDHVILDRSILRFDLTRREHYGLFLHIHYSALTNLEADWRTEDRVDFAGMLRCVQADLHTLRISAAPLYPMGRQILHPSNRLGLAYVLRGSRLGSMFLRRKVARNLPTAYLDFTPSLTWTDFLAQLESSTKLPNSNHEHDTIRGARITFEIFVSLFNRAAF